MRPVFVIDVRKILEAEVTVEQLTALSMFWMENAMKKLMVPGRVENFFVIIDVDNLGMTEIPRDRLRAVV